MTELTRRELCLIWGHLLSQENQLKEMTLKLLEKGLPVDGETIIELRQLRAKIDKMLEEMPEE